MLTRRSLLRLGAATALAGALPQTALAAGSACNLVVVFAFGGWDTTTIFDAKPGSTLVDTTAGSWVDAGGLTLWNPDNLPTSARQFLADNASDIAVINGVSVNSLVHEACLQTVLTGQVGDGHPPDVAARVAAELGADLPLPYLTTGAAARPAELAAQSGRIGYSNQLSSLLMPAYAWPDAQGAAAPGFRPDAGTREAVDAYLRSTHAGFASTRSSPGPNAQKLADWSESRQRAGWIRTHAVGGGFLSDPELFATFQPWRRAARALAEGFSRSVFVQDNGYWDTHGGNQQQVGLFGDLFDGLGQLLDELQLAGIREETVVMVVSEMGRMPLLNGQAGKDHWPFTSAMLIGSNVRSTVVHGTDEGLVQRPVNLTTGEPDPAGHPIHASDVLATVAHLTGVDAQRLYPQSEVIHAVVA